MDAEPGWVSEDAVIVAEQMLVHVTQDTQKAATPEAQTGGRPTPP